MAKWNLHAVFGFVLVIIGGGLLALSAIFLSPNWMATNSFLALIVFLFPIAGFCALLGSVALSFIGIMQIQKSHERGKFLAFLTLAIASWLLVQFAHYVSSRPN